MMRQRLTQLFLAFALLLVGAACAAASEAAAPEPAATEAPVAEEPVEEEPPVEEVLPPPIAATMLPTASLLPTPIGSVLIPLNGGTIEASQPVPAIPEYRRLTLEFPLLPGCRFKESCVVTGGFQRCHVTQKNLQEKFLGLFFPFFPVFVK